MPFRPATVVWYRVIFPFTATPAALCFRNCLCPLKIALVEIGSHHVAPQASQVTVLLFLGVHHTQLTVLFSWGPGSLAECLASKLETKEQACTFWIWIWTSTRCLWTPFGVNQNFNYFHYKFFPFICRSGFTFMYVCVPHACLVPLWPGGFKSLELEFHCYEPPCVCTGNRIWVLLKSSQCS